MEKFKSHLPQIVYGGSDGAVSYFTLMAGAYGAGMPVNMLIAIGISNVVADAFSMASADYLSEDSKGKSDFQKEIKDSAWTFISFIITGLFPLIPTFYQYLSKNPNDSLTLAIFLASISFTIIGITIIGYLRGRILKRDIYRTIAQSLFVCTISAVAAYLIGEFLGQILF